MTSNHALQLDVAYGGHASERERYAATMSLVDILGVERAKVLAWALKCHPGVLVFPGWQLPDKAAAYTSFYRTSAPRWRGPATL